MSHLRLDLEALCQMVEEGCSAAALMAAILQQDEASCAARRKGNRERQARLRHARRNGVTGGKTFLETRSNEIKDLDVTVLRNAVTPPSLSLANKINDMDVTPLHRNGVTPSLPFPPKEVSPHTPLQEITPLPLSSILSVSKRKPTTYTKAFENFWLKYPRTPAMSKLEASRAWQRLTEEDQNSALQAIEPYRRFLQQKPNLETVHACRFLSQRRFEGFCEGAAAAAPLFDVRRHLV